MFVWLPLKIVKLEFAFTFPPANRLIAREGTVILAALIMRIRCGGGFASRERRSGMHDQALQGDAARSSARRPRRADRAPLFLIYAGQGVGGEELNPEYFEAASQPKTLWKIDEAGHVGGFEARPEEYEQRVIAFFDRALLSEPE